MRRLTRALWAGWLACVVVVAVHADEASDAPAYERIVSLSPVLTQVVVDLGLGDRLVGVAEYDNVRPDLPIAGSFGEADAERVLTLSPDVVLVTGLGGEPKASVIAAAERVDAEVFAWELPMRLSMIETTVFNDDEPAGVSQALGVPGAGRALRESWSAELDDLATSAKDEVAGRRVLLLLDANPASALGPGSPFVELVERLGAQSASPLATAWGVLDAERLMLAEPDVVLLLRPGDAPLSGDADGRVAPLADVWAGRGVRVALIDHPLGLLPSTALPEVAEAMVEAIAGRRGVVLGADEGTEP
ncbi:MAG: ABC transporter substrate-binding protein [Planctomycetota bacterium]